MKDKGPIVIILFIAIIAIVGIAAFLAYKYMGGNNTGTDGGPVEITYLGLWDNEEIYTDLIKQYEEENPNITVKYTRASFINTPNIETYTYQGAYQAEAEERLKSGSADIIRVHQSWLPKVSSQIAAAPTTIISAEEAKSYYYDTDAIIAPASDGAEYVIASPQTIDGLVLFYNQDLFAQAGITDPESATKDWDVTLETAKKLTQISSNNTTLDISGINMGSVSNIQSSPEILVTMLTQSGINVVYYDKTQGTYSADFASSEGAAALKRYFEFSQEQVWSSRSARDLDLFANGKLAMYIAPSWRAIDIVQMNSNLRFDSLKIPVLPGANPDVDQYVTSYWLDVVSRNSQHPAEAWKFLNWLSQPEQLRKIYNKQIEVRMIGNPYPRKDMAEEQKDAPFIGPILEMAPTMHYWPLFDYGAWEEIFRYELLEYEDHGGPEKENLETIQNRLNNEVLNKKIQ